MGVSVTVSLEDMVGTAAQRSGGIEHLVYKPLSPMKILRPREVKQFAWSNTAIKWLNGSLLWVS